MSAPTCYCGTPMRLRNGRWGKWWSCPRYPACDGAIGCHPGTEKPLGIPADRATRDARKEAHAAFDALWLPMENQRRDYRAAAYRWLSEHLGQDSAHIGAMDRDTALRVAEVCQEMGPEDVEPYLEPPR